MLYVYRGLAFDCIQCAILLMSFEFYFETVSCKNLDLSAFDYETRYSEPLSLGDCPTRTIEQLPGLYIDTPCTFRRKGVTRFISREMNDTRNQPLYKASDALVYSGLCRSDSASYFGLLHRGDCYAVEISGNLTFSSKTHARAYIEYYRSGIEVLEAENKLPFPPGLSHYYEDVYYLQHRSIGSMEMIIIEIMYKQKSKAQAARRIPVDLLQSTYLQDIERNVGRPKLVKVIRFSTALKIFNVRKFSTGEFSEASALVRDYEYDLHRIREQIRREYIRPSVTYGFMPFLPATASRDATSEFDWEKSTLIEIEIKNILASSKRTKKRCRNSELQACTVISKILRELKMMQKVMHDKRSRWMSLERSEQYGAANDNVSKIVQFAKKLKTLGRVVSKAYKGRKNKKTKKKTKKGKSKGKQTKLIK